MDNLFLFKTISCQRGDIQVVLLKFNVFFWIMAGEIIVSIPMWSIHPNIQASVHLHIRAHTRTLGVCSRTLNHKTTQPYVLQQYTTALPTEIRLHPAFRLRQIVVVVYLLLLCISFLMISLCLWYHIRLRQICGLPMFCTLTPAGAWTFEAARPKRLMIWFVLFIVM